MTIDDWNPGIEAEIDDMYAAGISSFKMYMTYPAMMIGDEAMYHALKKLREKGGICGVHCENSGVIDALIAEKKAAGGDGRGLPSPDPARFPEAEAVSRLLRIAQAVDIPVVIVHLTNAAALREVEAARKRGQRVYVETCPQYLLLDDSVYDDPDYSRAARYVCAPPIRKTEDQRVLWAALRKGEIQTVSTDHCSFTLEQKDAGRGDFTRIPGRPAGGGDPGRAAVYLRRYHAEDQPGHHVPGAVGKPRQALRYVPPEGRAPGRGRRGYRGVRSPGGPSAPGGGHDKPGGLHAV